MKRKEKSWIVWKNIAIPSMGEHICVCNVWSGFTISFAIANHSMCSVCILRIAHTLTYNNNSHPLRLPPYRLVIWQTELKWNQKKYYFSSPLTTLFHILSCQFFFIAENFHMHWLSVHDFDTNEINSNYAQWTHTHNYIESCVIEKSIQNQQQKPLFTEFSNGMVRSIFLNLMVQ